MISKVCMRKQSFSCLFGFHSNTRDDTDVPWWFVRQKAKQQFLSHKFKTSSPINGLLPLFSWWEQLEVCFCRAFFKFQLADYV